MRPEDVFEATRRCGLPCLPVEAPGLMCKTAARDGAAVALPKQPSGARAQFSAASVTTWVHAPSGAEVMTGSDPPASRVATVRS